MPSEPGADDEAISIRPEKSADPGERASIRAIHEAAFGGSEEAELVDALRAAGEALLSLIAELDGRIVGHILFSRMWIETPSGLVSAVALAPVAVGPEFQRRGIGSLLIRRGLETIRSQGEQIVIVVGHPDYYPRFGFSPDRARQLRHPFPPEAFMALELTTGALDGIEGKVVYPQPFGI